MISLDDQLRYWPERLWPAGDGFGQVLEQPEPVMSYARIGSVFV